jgi:hypothetical protein
MVQQVAYDSGPLTLDHLFHSLFMRAELYTEYDVGESNVITVTNANCEVVEDPVCLLVESSSK